jgi:membrane protein DedA with SNARE-associated domain
MSGALAATGALRPELVLVSAFLAALLADHGWFVFGRRYGRRFARHRLPTVASPDTCVRRTDDLITRHGVHVAPGGEVHPGCFRRRGPDRGRQRHPVRRFLLFDALGCLLWSGAYVGAGVIFSREIERFLDALGWAGSGSSQPS